MAGNGNGSGTVNGKARGDARQPITVLIVDDERAFGEALEVVLAREKDLRVVHVATAGPEGVEVAGANRPDVVLMDVSMPGMNGIEATRRIREADPDAAVVILSGYDDEHLLARAMQAGASGLMRKTEAIVDIASTVRRAHRGEPIHEESDVEAARRRLRHRRDLDEGEESRLNRLTRRELEILSLMAAGGTPVAMAEELGMSPNTLRTHTQNVLTKLRVHSRTEALALAIRHGKVKIVDLPDASGAGGRG